MKYDDLEEDQQECIQQASALIYEDSKRHYERHINDRRMLRKNVIK